MARCLVKILLLPDSIISLVFRHQGLLLNSNGFMPNWGAEYKKGEKIGVFFTNKWAYFGNGARYGYSCYGS